MKIRQIAIPFSLSFLLFACGGDDPDTVAPVITLEGPASINNEIFTEYSDPGATALDDRDGQVAVTVEGEVNTDVLGEYQITYSATDQAGNISTALRTVNVVDTTPPVITLIEDPAFTLEYGNEYREYGATAEDNLDGEVTVEISSELDTFVAGTYDILYSATDVAGNEGTALRTVTVNPKRVTVTVDVFGAADLTVIEGPELTCDDSLFCTAQINAGEAFIVEINPSEPWIFHSWRGCDEVEGIPETQCSITTESDLVVSSTLSPNEDGFVAEFNANAVQLDSGLLENIVEYNERTGVITFGAGTDLSGIEPGTVIVSSGIENADGELEKFFLRRVEEIIGNPNNLRIVRSSEASLTDLVSEGTFVWQEALTAENLELESLPDEIILVPKAVGEQTNAVTQNSANDPIEFAVANLVVYDKDGQVSTKEDQISLTGGFKLFLNPDFALDIDFPARVNEFRSILYADLTPEIGLDIGGLVTTPNNLAFTLTKLRFAPIAIGPVIIKPEVELELAFEAGVGIAIKPRVTFPVRMVGGARYSAAKGWDGVSDLDFSASVNDWSQTIEVKAEAKAGPQVTFSTLLYGAAGPGINVKAMMGVEALPDIQSEQCLIDVNTFFEAAASFEAKFKLITKEFSYFADLIKYKAVIDSLSRNCGNGKPPTPEDIAVTQVGAGELEVSWTPVGQGAEITYKIIRDKVGIESGYLDSEYRDTRLNEGQEYCYSVIATDDMDMESDPSATVCAIVGLEDTTSPSVPSGLIATALSSSAINLEWTNSSDDVGVAGYTVYLSDESGQARAIDNTTEDNINILQLKAETEYCYSVSAYDNNGNVSPISGPACATTLGNESANWTMFIKCQSRTNYVVEDTFDLDEEFTSDVFVFGEATDYNGSQMYYSLFGGYDPETSQFDGEINWSFEVSQDIRKDTFSADLNTSDTGDINMLQVQRTGCDAAIRFVRQTGEDVQPDSTSEETGFGNINDF